ncbi:hypothetical protein V8B97DRAFT_1868055, partial [Scleroderma yunnanense]
DVLTTGWRRIGLQWCSLDYIVFLHLLDSIHKMSNMAGVGHPPKHHKTTKNTSMKMFDLHSTKMSDKLPRFMKAEVTKPFQSMMNKAWLMVHPSQEVLEGMVWLDGFYTCAHKEELSINDYIYLDELATWLSEQEDNDLFDEFNTMEP